VIWAVTNNGADSEIYHALWDLGTPGRVGGRNDHAGGGRKHGQRPGVPQELLPVRFEQGRKNWSRQSQLLLESRGGPPFHVLPEEFLQVRLKRRWTGWSRASGLLLESEVNGQMAAAPQFRACVCRRRPSRVSRSVRPCEALNWCVWRQLSSVRRSLTYRLTARPMRRSARSWRAAWKASPEHVELRDELLEMRIVMWTSSAALSVQLLKVRKRPGSDWFLKQVMNLATRFASRFFCERDQQRAKLVRASSARLPAPRSQNSRPALQLRRTRRRGQSASRPRDGLGPLRPSRPGDPCTEFLLPGRVMSVWISAKNKRTLPMGEKWSYATPHSFGFHR